jgi:hypothetical protein
MDGFLFMNIALIEGNLQKIIKNFSDDNKDGFIYELLRTYGLPKSSITRLQKGTLNLSKKQNEIIWKKKLFFKVIPTENLYSSIDEYKKNPAILKHDPRFLLITDYDKILSVDTKTCESLDTTIKELPKHYDFFLPWAGMEKHQVKSENPADVKAAERMAKLFDEIKKDNPNESPEFIHGLNVFMSRLLFCYFAEDTGIFAKDQFTNALSSHTQSDGSDLQTYLEKFFEVLNIENRNNLPAYLEAFPYVNGGLFRDKYPIPVFTRRSRQAIIDSGELDWAAINPDIFGSMIQAVVTPEHRGGLGMHYTSVPNIMKVIEPLFLNELYEEFEKAKGNDKKLFQLLERIKKIKIFDPACGSGNFLIIAYKELRKLEMKIFKETNSLALSAISLSQLYGIEIDDFAHEVAILSLWLAEHQMNVEFFNEFGRTNPTLPLKDAGHITCGNATRIDWEEVCPKNKDDEIYILGNPPYLGSSMQNKEQKADLAFVCDGFKNYKNLDFIACWFIKGADYIKDLNAQYAFVSTNSICQGEQVALLWPYIFDKNLEIGFAHKSFKWTNNAKGNAGVTCVIVGIRNCGHLAAKLYNNGISQSVKSINAYLEIGDNIIVKKLSKPISDLPPMSYGNKAVDGGNLILNDNEKQKLVKEYPETERFIRPLLGASDYIRGNTRWCIWIKDSEVREASKIAPITSRIEKVKHMRLASPDKSANEMSKTAHRFREQKESTHSTVIVPATSSERRKYIPMGFLSPESIITNASQAIYDPEPWIFAVISSMMHMLWVRAVGGRLETRIRYSSALCYNTFPFPDISNRKKEELTGYVYRILEERERFPEKTLAELYDPDKMPDGLREAHHQNDLAVERCYRSKPFTSDSERLEYLFKLYEKMTSEESK